MAKRDRARGLGAAVPGDQHVVADDRGGTGGAISSGPTALEQGRLECRHAGRHRILERPADHDQVEHPAEAADRRMPTGGLDPPVGADAAASGQARGPGQPVPSHETLEGLPRALRPLARLALEAGNEVRRRGDEAIGTGGDDVRLPGRMCRPSM